MVMVTTDDLLSEIRALPNAEKMSVVDAIIKELHKPDSEIDRVWAEEAKRRWAAYKEGQIETMSYEKVIAKYREGRPPKSNSDHSLS